MKKKVLLTSIATIALCLCLIAGSTFALFTSQSKTNIAVTSGNVDVVASVKDFKLYSVEANSNGTIVDENGGKYEYVDRTTEGTFVNGGTAVQNGSMIELDKITPGDKISFGIQATNNSDVAIQCRYIIQCVEGEELMEGLVVYINDVPYQSLKSYTSAWTALAVGESITDNGNVEIVIELPVTAGNEYQGKKDVAINVLVEAVQSNADVVIGGNATVELVGGKAVADADGLVATLENGENVLLETDVNIDPAGMSNAYGTTGINVKNGQTIDGGGNTLDIAGAGGTWDSGISTTGGIIRNITVTGSFRGIFINHNSTHSEKVVLENVTIDGTTYTISCDQGTNKGLDAINSTFNGWTSYAATLGEAKFVNCNFGEGNGYAFCRPYAPTEFVGCEFEAGYTVDPRAAVTFENCTLNGVAITEDNIADLVTNITNVTVK